MRGKLAFLAGAAIGFVIGARAGREKYENLVGAARKLLDSPTVQEAGGVVQAQASKLYTHGKETLGNSKIAERLRKPEGDDVLDDDVPNRQPLSTNSF